MKYEFEKVIDGLSKYIDSVIYPGMADWQEFTARVLVGRFLNNENGIKESLMNNGFIRTFAIIDSDGKVDVGSLCKDIKRELSKKEKITFNLPMFGKLTFKPDDVDVIYKTITGEEFMSYESN